MQTESYKGYAVWGQAIREQQDILERERYAASGTVTKGGKFIEASGILGVMDSESAAEQVGLEWARVGRQRPLKRQNQTALPVHVFDWIYRGVKRRFIGTGQ